MRDKVSIERITKLHPKIRDRVTRAIDAAEAKLGPYTAIRIVQGARTITEQNALYSLGRTLKNHDARPGKPLGSIVTNAKGGQSYHNFMLAVDCAILYDKDKNGTFESLSWDLLADGDKDGLADWKEMVLAFQAEGFEWGGNWKSLKDNPHFQDSFGHSVTDLLTRWTKNDFIPGTQFVNI